LRPQVEVNSGGNVYFCFCSGHGSQKQDGAGTSVSDDSPNRGPSQHALGPDQDNYPSSAAAGRMQNNRKDQSAGEDSWTEPVLAELRRRVVSDDGAVRRLSEVMQAAADEETSADAIPAAGSAPGGNNGEASTCHSNSMGSTDSPHLPRGLPLRPSSAAAALAPDRRTFGSSDGVLQQARALHQSCQWEAAHSQQQPAGQLAQDTLEAAARSQDIDNVQAPQAAQEHGDQCQQHAPQRQHSMPLHVQTERQHSETPATPGGQHLPDRLLVVKFLPARLDAQSEQFASELARHLGVPSPACRILRKQVAFCSLACAVTHC
jgi:hypothetical protein